MSGFKDTEALLPPSYSSLWQRWYIISLFGLLGCVQALVWNGWDTVSNSMYFAYPTWDNSTIALLGNWGEICYLAFVVPGTWVVQERGIRWGALLCAGIMLLGTGLRCLQWFFAGTEKAEHMFKWLAHAGGILNGSAGVMVCVIPSVISSLWFPPGERTIATGLSWFFLESGNALGFLIGPLVVRDPPKNGTIENQTSSMNFTEEKQDIQNDVLNLMYVHASLCGIIFLLLLIYFPSKPPQPPSPTSVAPREKFLDGLMLILRNKNAMLVILAFSLSQGMQEAFTPVLDLDLTPLGVPQKSVGWLGFWASLASSITCIFISYLSEKFKGNFKPAILTFLLLSLGFFTWQSLLVLQVVPFSMVQLYISTMAAFSINYACTPLFFELGSELAYPAGEGVMAGLMTCVWTILGIIYLSIFFIKNIGYTWMNWTSMICVGLSIPAVLLIKENHNRKDVDDKFDKQDVG